MKIKLLVAEPWNFISPDGQNVLFGEASLQERGVHKYWEWLITKSTPFIIDNQEIATLLLSPRQKNVHLVDDLIAGKSVPVNAYYGKRGLILDYDLVASAYRESRIKELIGGFLIAHVVKDTRDE